MRWKLNEKKLDYKIKTKRTKYIEVKKSKQKTRNNEYNEYS